MGTSKFPFLTFQLYTAIGEKSRVERENTYLRELNEALEEMRRREEKLQHFQRLEIIGTRLPRRGRHWCKGSAPPGKAGWHCPAPGSPPGSGYPFFTTKRTGEGTGLGLSIVQSTERSPRSGTGPAPGKHPGPSG